MNKSRWSLQDQAKLKKEVYAKEAQKYYEREGGKQDKRWEGFEKRAEAKFQQELRK